MKRHSFIPKVLEDTFLMLCYINTESFTYFRKFFSELEQREITPNETGYLQTVRSELIYRIEIFSTEICSCSNCKEELAKYLSTLQLVDNKIGASVSVIRNGAE